MENKNTRQEDRLESKHKHKIEHWHKVTALLILYDIVTVVLSYFLALWVRYDCAYTQIPQAAFSAFVKFAPFYAVFCIVVFWTARLYRSIWRFASFSELYRVIIATLITGFAHTLVMTFFIHEMPISYYLWGMGFQFMFSLGIRFSYRFAVLELKTNRLVQSQANTNICRVMVYGAGSAGQMIVKDILNTSNLNEECVCICDDNSNKWGRFIMNIPIVGGRDEIASAVRKYNVDKIYIAIPSASKEDKRAILNACAQTDCELRQLPGMYQLMIGDITTRVMKPVAIEDLLGRDSIKTNLEEVYQFIKGKTILVTGGGGSIGSELCRQIAAHDPERLIIFDVYENNAYEIQLELREKYPNLKLEALIGSVRDSRKLCDVFNRFHPEVVYHAAAHKHVPLMEDSPNEAIKNNAIGTYKTAYAAAMFGCKRFVLISTDKAVNPTNIMGASKRLCEMIIQSFDAKIKQGKAHELPNLFTHADEEDVYMNGYPDHIPDDAKTEFVAVRFGNVLGSNGSVVPIFRRQIEAGGPVTVVDKNINRFFMLISEAVSLVLLAGTYAGGGEIFVLDMGEPVKIDTLARNMIKLYGLKPDVDIKIIYTGLRPGEKLYEEKLMAEEGLKKTQNDLIHIGCPIPFDTDSFLGELSGLMAAAYRNTEDIRDRVMQIVSTYHPAENSVKH